MTTNARDEKWSRWVDHDGNGVPIDDNTKFEYRMRAGTALVAMDKASDYEPMFIHKDCASDIIAYRYKIKEPESDMHPDLEWLARNVSEWDAKYPDSFLIHKDKNGHGYVHPESYAVKFDGYIAFSRAQLQAARQQLGLDQKESTMKKCLDNAWDEPTPEEEEAWQAKEQKQSNSQYSAYFKDVRHIDTIDVYRVVSLFDCEKHGHAISHAAKKLLLTGARTGGKDVETEVREAIDSLHRWLEMREEDARA